MNQFPVNSPETEKTPRWETVAMVLSFALVWAYFLVFQSARRGNLSPHFGWNVALLLAVGALVVIFVRRLKRILAALDAQNKRR
ncbi:hypothetical protein B1R32_102153 [Abditibacterium utsteinense]|uniref:Uncharacterized protein n=1 Tax=Abditibacterium utsteinense TaxID=1960156 RepID=A0A2S8SWG8_9BACT|nr:hypothetical protein [Abditibacterium utsteinense]PQV65145.1 hypothetical protein B1R32_102153 [Abditibacterium utsteinense]